MQYIGIESIKNAYRDRLQELDKTDKAVALELKSLTTPVFDGIVLHPEAEPVREDINDALQQVAIDFLALDAEVSSAAQRYSNLVNDILVSLDSVDEIIAMEEERIEDMNIISGNFPEFVSIKSLTTSNLTGNASAEDDNTITCPATERTSVLLSVLSVAGNGYEGNKYVYNNGVFEQESFNSNVHTNMTDASSTSYYEYSRMTMTTKQQHYPADANFDDIEAECVITLGAQTTFNTLKIQSDLQGTLLKQVYYSTDEGVTYKEALEEPLAINDPSKKYENDEYIFGSGIISFPATKYVKLQFQSKGALEDTLAFKKLIIDDSLVNNGEEFIAENYISQYLGPIFAIACHSSIYETKVPPSILLAIALARTGTKSSAVGYHNFWAYPYSEDLTDLPSDNEKSAFPTAQDFVTSILYLFTISTGLREALEPLSTLGLNSTSDDKLLAMENILKVIEKNHSRLYTYAADYIQRYNLYRYDSISLSTWGFDEEHKTYTIEGETKTLTEDNVISMWRNIFDYYSPRYEQFLMRYDQQEIEYTALLEQAESTILLETAKRHVIRINDITALTNTYEEYAVISSGELLTGAVSSIAVFANEYIPSMFPADESTVFPTKYFQYVLTLNGQDYEVVPVNSHKQGTKIIRYSGYSVIDDYVYHLNEPIKTASLTVKITTPDSSYTPYLSNLKVCLGKAVVS